MRYRNPVHPAYLADPFVWRVDRSYFAIGTGPAEAAGTVAAPGGDAGVFPLLRSTDLVHWRPIGRALHRPDPSLGDTFWAPEVACDDGRWYLYYSVGRADRGHRLRVAASAAPIGPYVDLAGLTDPDEVPFAIDPHPFRDADGRWYLFHARDFVDDDDPTGARAGTALVVQPLASMTRLGGPCRTVLRARHDWQRFAADRPMYGRRFDWHTLEGPFVIRHDGRYHCLYSGGRWEADAYGVDVAVADAVDGPYDDRGAEHGPRVLRTVAGHVLGPGHCSVATAPDDETPVVVYHAWDPAMTARTMRIDPLRWTADGPRCSGPSWTPRELPAAPAGARARRTRGGR